MNQPSAQQALQDAIACFSTTAALAAAAGVKRQSIHSAVKAGRVSPELAEAIEKATGGKVSKYRLVFGDEPKAIRVKRRKVA